MTGVLNIRPENRGSIPSGDEDFFYTLSRADRLCTHWVGTRLCEGSFKRMRLLKVELPVINRLNIRKLTVSSVIEQFGLFLK